MKYVLALIIIVVYNVVAKLISPLLDMTMSNALTCLTLGGFALLAGDYYTTKEER